MDEDLILLMENSFLKWEVSYVKLAIHEMNKGREELGEFNVLYADLRNNPDKEKMALALQESSSNSLIIVDEFGKGTSEVDGLALLAACLNTFLFQEERCPHLLLSTHFLDIQKYIVNTPIVRFMRFEHTVHDGEPVFLFRLAAGSADCSFAHDVALASGIDAHVIQRARVVMDSIANNTQPPENKKITAKLRSFTEIIKRDLLAEDI